MFVCLEHYFYNNSNFGWFVYSAVLQRTGRSLPAKDTVALSLESYSCKHPRRGRCVIINNQHFNRLLTGQSDRDGTEVDAAVVESMFVSLGFEVMRYDDLSINDMSIYLREGTTTAARQAFTYFIHL